MLCPLTVARPPPAGARQAHEDVAGTPHAASNPVSFEEFMQRMQALKGVRITCVLLDSVSTGTRVCDV